MIDFTQVKFSYDGDSFVLDELNLHVECGEFICILGGNGSGKSTLAKHIDALLVPDEGSVHVLDCDTADDKNTYFVRSRAGLVFQNPDDQLVASIVENDVAFGPENLGVSSQDLRKRVISALAKVGLQGFDRRETSTLSGGQKQRVAIAGVLAMKPDILVLDEATSMLDPRGRSGLMRVCRELHEQGMTIVMITHFMDEASLSKRVVVLDEGKVRLDGPPEDILVQAALMEHLNLDVPFATKLSFALQKRGVNVATQVDSSRLKEELCLLRSKR